MITKTKYRFIALMLAIAIVASVIVTVNIMKPVSAEASSDYMDIPQITVLTHGLSSSAANWSNDDGSGTGGFVEDSDSLVYKLSQKAGGADIYRAVTYGGDISAPKYKLYEGYTDINNGENNCNGIVDISKHIIIVFESESSSESNDVVYNEFENMLMDVIDRVQDLNPGGKKPKVNLIGHSRGGITNLQFTLDHPEYVESMISIGTPYFGSPVAGLAGPLVFGENDGMTDINDETIYNDYYTKWTNGYESKYKDINSIAIGATTTIEYQRAI